MSFCEDKISVKVLFGSWSIVVEISKTEDEVSGNGVGDDDVLQGTLEEL